MVQVIFNWERNCFSVTKVKNLRLALSNLSTVVKTLHMPTLLIYFFNFSVVEYVTKILKSEII